MTDIDLAEHRTIHGIVAAERVCRAELIWRGCLNHGGPLERQLGPMLDMSDVLEHKGRTGWVIPFSDGIARPITGYGV